MIDQPVRRSPINNYNEPGVKILRLGRSSSESAESRERQSSREKKPTEGNILRFGRADNMMRFGRGNMMRFGRGNMMRFGRGDNMMRFGRAGNVMRFGKRGSDDNDYSRSNRAGNVLRFGRSDKNPMRFGKRGDVGAHAVSSSSKIYCEDYNCLLQEKENRLIDNDNDEQLKSLFGVDHNDNDDDDAKQSLHNEYIIQK